MYMFFLYKNICINLYIMYMYLYMFPPPPELS